MRRYRTLLPAYRLQAHLQALTRRTSFIATLLLALLARSGALLISTRAPCFSPPRARATRAVPRARSADDDRFEALRDLRNGASGKGGPRGEFSMEFPPTLSAGQRAMLHAAAAQLGLAHDSVGNGDRRRVRAWAKGADERLTDLASVLAEQERAGTVAPEAHAAVIEHLRHELASRPSGPIANLLSFLLGPYRQAPNLEIGPEEKGGEEIGDRMGSRELMLLDSFLGQEQRKAVESCLGTGGSAQVVVIQGLPGTGKSRTLLEVMRQHARQGKVRLMRGAQPRRPRAAKECVTAA